MHEGLVNYIMVTPYLHSSLLKKWRYIGGDRVHIWPDLMPRAQSAASYARTAKNYYDAGADGLRTVTSYSVVNSAFWCEPERALLAWVSLSIKTLRPGCSNWEPGLFFAPIIFLIG